MNQTADKHSPAQKRQWRCSEPHGVEIIFGLCGDTSLPFYDALARLPHGMRHILARDERSAAYMADGYARVSGKVGVCEGPSGGGVTYIIPGLAEANESSVPLLCINSDISVAARGRYTLTELDDGALMRPLTKWHSVLDRSEDLPNAFRAAFRQITTGRPGAAHIACLSMCRTARSLDPMFGAICNYARYPAERSGARRRFRRARRPFAARGGPSGFHLRRRRSDFRGAEGIARSRRAALGAGGDDHQRQRLHRRTTSARRRRGRIQRRHA